MRLPKISREDVINADRELCQRGLAHFARRAWRVLEPQTPLKWGWALDAICEHLEAVSRKEIHELLINVPPGCMKSLLTGVIWPAYEWGPLGMPHLRYLGTAHKEPLAVRDNVKCRRLIRSEWYQRLWPIELTGDQDAKTKFENSSTGFREAMAFTSMTGSRGDRVLIDDPHSVDDANSVAKLAKGVQTFREAVPSRVNNSDSAKIIIMQRLNEKDISAVAIELGYDHLCIPMRFEERRAPTSIGWVDPRSEPGELMFPERFSELEVQRLEKSLQSYGTASQLQQRPAPAGGGILKLSWFGQWSTLPKFKYRMIYADTAQKEGEKNDYSVLQHWGLGVDGRIYLIDMIRGQWEAPDLLVHARAFWEKCRRQHSGTLRKMKVEDKSSGTGLIQQLKRGANRVPVEGIPRSRDKVSRAFDVAPQIEAGHVMLPSGGEHMSDMLREIELFPAGAHDDAVDPMMDAISDMLITEPTVIYTGIGSAM